MPERNAVRGAIFETVGSLSIAAAAAACAAANALRNSRTAIITLIVCTAIFFPFACVAAIIVSVGLLCCVPVVCFGLTCACLPSLLRLSARLTNSAATALSHRMRGGLSHVARSAENLSTAEKLIIAGVGVAALPALCVGALAYLVFAPLTVPATLGLYFVWRWHSSSSTREPPVASRYGGDGRRFQRGAFGSAASDTSSVTEMPLGADSFYEAKRASAVASVRAGSAASFAGSAAVRYEPPPTKEAEAAAVAAAAAAGIEQWGRSKPTTPHGGDMGGAARFLLPPHLGEASGEACCKAGGSGGEAWRGDANGGAALHEAHEAAPRHSPPRHSPRYKAPPTHGNAQQRSAPHHAPSWLRDGSVCSDEAADEAAAAMSWLRDNSHGGSVADEAVDAARHARHCWPSPAPSALAIPLSPTASQELNPEYLGAPTRTCELRAAREAARKPHARRTHAARTRAHPPTAAARLAAHTREEAVTSVRVSSRSRCGSCGGKRPDRLPGCGSAWQPAAGKLLRFERSVRGSAHSRAVCEARLLDRG